MALVISRVLRAEKLAELKNKLSSWRADEDLREVGVGALTAMFLRAVGAILTLGVNIVIARLLGASDTGLYFTALATITIGSVISKLGMENALLRHIAASFARDDWGQVRAVAGLGLISSSILAGVTTICLFGFAPLISKALVGSDGMVTAVKLMSLSIVPLVYSNLIGQCLKALKLIKQAMLVQGVLTPGLMLLVIFPLVYIFGLNGAFVSYFGATSLAALYGWWNWRESLKHREEKPAKLSASSLWSSCKFLYPISLINQAIVPWVPLLALSTFASLEDVGVLGAASRLAALVSFILIAVNNILAPRFAELYEAKRLNALARIARISAFCITVVTMPAFVVLFLFGDWVMGVFGAEFRQGGDILAILLVGQVANTVCGSVAYLLNMTGNEKILFKITCFVSVLLVLLSALLIPLYGAYGAATATSFSLVAFNFLCWMYAQKTLGIDLNWLKNIGSIK